LDILAHRVGGALTYRYDRSVTSRITAETPGVFAQTFSVPEHAIDELGHVSNLKYLAWMQEIAIQHSTARAWPVERYLENGAVWVVRSHFITYLRPAFAGEAITLLTWVAEFRQRSSARCYLVRRTNDQRVLVEAETVWVYVDRQSGRPCKIPDDLRAAFLVVQPFRSAAPTIP
jgi:acyl-CoA thioester hydrolase